MEKLFRLGIHKEKKKIFQGEVIPAGSATTVDSNWKLKIERALGQKDVEYIQSKKWAF